MGVETNRIETEFILKSVIERKIPVKIHVRNEILESNIIEFDLEKKIILKTSGKDNQRLNKNDNVNIYFSYYSHVMNFRAVILDAADKVSITYPEKIYKNLSRKYERVSPPEGSKIVFTVKGEKFQLDFPKTEEYYAVDVAEFNTDKYEVSNIKNLINNFRNKMLESVSEVNIVTYRKQKPDSLEENLISTTGKALYIQSTNLDLPENVEAGDVPVLTAEIIDSIIQDGYKLIKTRNFEKSSQGIHSEIYCPVLYLEYVIGHIHVINRDNNKTLLTTEILEHVHEFAKVLAFALKLNHYFSDKIDEYEKFESRMIDISASGLLFSSTSKKLDKSFYLYTDLKIEIFIGDKSIPVVARIMRKFKNEDTVFYGLIFLEIDEKDFETLFYLVYGRKLTEEDLNQWEGGASPPQIEL